MADLISSDSNKQSDNILFSNKLYEPLQEDISDLRPWGTKKYDRAGGYADVSCYGATVFFFFFFSFYTMVFVAFLCFFFLAHPTFRPENEWCGMCRATRA